MRSCALAAVVVLLVQGTLRAQPGLDFPMPEPTDAPGRGVITQPGLWFTADVLLWWVKNGGAPPLVTVGGDGIIGHPGTRVPVDGLDFDEDFRPGMRFALGYRFDTAPYLGIEGDCFFLSDRLCALHFASRGEPVLGRPYVNAVTGLPAATLIASPGMAEGELLALTTSSLDSVEVNGTADLIATPTLRLTALGGFRYLQFEDQLSISEEFLFAGSAVKLQDHFRTLNNFYGGQVGAAASAAFDRLVIDVRAKFAFGQMQQVAEVGGGTDVIGPTGAFTHFNGGLFALPTNIGRHTQNDFAFVPEVGVNFAAQVSPRLKLFAGYTFLWVSTVARAGEQIDPVVNESQFPILSGNAPVIGAPRPAFHFRTSDIWAQGVNIGFELRF